MLSPDVALLSVTLLTSFSSTFSSELTKEGNIKYRQPPPREHLTKDRRCVGGPHPYNDSSFNCHGAKFVATNGYFQPCNRHSHCYGSREPTDWCVMAPHFRWTNWGCHCDYKLGSCLIERYDYKSRQLQWGYCNLKSEFYCATHLDAFRERITTTTRKPQQTPTTTPKSRVDRKP